MTAIGRPREAADAFALAIRRRGLREVRSEHTRELVRQELPPGIPKAVQLLAARQDETARELAEAREKIARLERVLMRLALEAARGE